MPMALLKQLQILDEEDRMNAALVTLAANDDPSFKRFLVHPSALHCLETKSAAGWLNGELRPPT
jgi:hypothetical protein